MHSKILQRVITALLISLLAGAGWAAPVMTRAHDATPAPIAGLPEGPLGVQIQWLVDFINLPESEAADVDLTTKFTPGVLADVPADQLAAILSRYRSQLAPITVDTETMVTTTDLPPTNANFNLVGADGTLLPTSMSVDPTSGLISSIWFAAPIAPAAKEPAALGASEDATETVAPTATATLQPTQTPQPTATAASTQTPLPTATTAPTETPLPTATTAPTQTPLPTATEVPTETATATATEEPTETATATETEEPTQTPSLTATEEPTETATATETEEPTQTPSLTATEEPTETATATETEEPTQTPSLTATEEPTETATATETEEPTQTPSLTATKEPTETATATETEEPTQTPSLTATEEPTETATATETEEPTQTPSLTATEEPTETATATETEEPTQTPSLTATKVPTQTPSATATKVPTQTPSATATKVPTLTPSATATKVPTRTPSATATQTSTQTVMATATEEKTETATEEPTEIASPMASPAGSPMASPMASPVAADFPSGALGDQAAWTWSVLNNGGEPIAESEVEKHVSPETLALVPAAQIVAGVAQIQEQFGPFTLETESMTVSADEPPTNLIYRVVGKDGTVFQVSVSIDPTTGLLTRFQIAPATSAASPVASPLADEITDTVVTFTSGGDTIYGSLMAPADLSPSESRPAAQIISGSGPTDRDGNSGGLPLGTNRNLAVTLAEAGIPSLRYDKLGSGQTGLGSHADGTSIDYELFLQEAKDAAAALAAQPGVDPSQLILIGHSEGALFALALAQAMTEAGTPPAGLILGAPLSVRYLDIIQEQLEAQGQAAIASGQMTDNQVAALSTELQGIIDSLRNNGTLPETPISPEFSAIFNPSTTAFLTQIDKIDPAEIAASLPADIPVLVLLGNKDAQVTGDQVRHLTDGFDAAGNENVRFVALPKADHTLRIVEGEANPAVDYANPDLPFSPLAVTEINKFLADNDLAQ